MDSYTDIDDGSEVELDRRDEPSPDAPPGIGVDERRMHVRAYNYWVSLLAGRAYPSIADLEPQNLDDFGPYSVLLNFSADPENPQIVFIGKSLREECRLDAGVSSIADVPPRSLLSRLTDHYLQIIANCAPIGFEAEFTGQGGVHTMYRGILMPLSSDGDSIDFIYGVINWKEVVDSETALAIANAAIGSARQALQASPVWADGPNAEPLHGDGADAFADDGLGADDQPSLNLHLADDAALVDRLCLARDCAEAATAADQRSRTALYRALGYAHDFALAAAKAPEELVEIFADAGIKPQARAPMTAIAKLVFGAGYDKARLTEFAAALAWAAEEQVQSGGFAEWVSSFPGGLKGAVQAARAARRPAAKHDRTAAARDRLGQLPAIGYVEVETKAGTGDFVLLVARCEADGRLAVVAPVDADKALIERAIRSSAG